MAKRVRLMALALAAALLCGCGNTVTEEARVLSDLRQSYRNADLVVTGECVEVHDVDGVRCAALRVQETVAGRPPEDIVHCTAADMQAGNGYLVYLKRPDAPLAGEPNGYTAVAVAAWSAAEDAATAEGVRLPMSVIRTDMENLNTVISAPADIWYYEKMPLLARAADEICIGRVEAMPALEETAFRSTSDNATVEHTLPAALATVRVYGSIKGACRYGEDISLVQAPGLSADLVDAAKLTAVRYGEADVPALNVGSYYVFFLQRGPDAKQAYYFCVNPVQGYVLLEKDILRPGSANQAAAQYQTLLELVVDIKAALA